MDLNKNRHQEVATMQGHIEDFYREDNNPTKDLTLDNEYRSMTGHNYEYDRKIQGGIDNSQNRLLHIDKTVTQSLYIHGHDKKDIVRAVMIHSPAVKTIDDKRRENYAKKLRQQMSEVESKRQKMDKTKETYGIKTNCKRDIENYRKCIKAEQKARKQGMMVNHLTYQRFQKERSPDFYKKHIAKIERDTAKQQKLDRERQQKKEQERQIER